MELKELYSLRNNFTVIGLTGRTGSGCSKIAEILSSEYSRLKEGLRDEDEFNDQTFKKKYSICKNYLSHKDNWVPFHIIKYVDVLLFYILYKYGKDQKNIARLFLDNFNDDEDNKIIVDSLLKEIYIINDNNSEIIDKIKNIGEIETLTNHHELANLENIFFGEQFSQLKASIYDSLDKHGYFRTRLLFHRVATNIRKTGDPLKNKPEDIIHIYSIAKLINKLIKSKRIVNKGKPTKIVIDSLRNSLELMFFKERYSAFYMVAIKDIIDNSKSRIMSRLIEKKISIDDAQILLSKILELDATEYKTNDFQRGQFSSPDVENCIQKSDYHIYNLKISDLEKFIRKYFDGNNNGFFTREEQILKLLALIQQPGIITPSPAERCMQIAHTAELNSGCISRRVGAVVTDSSFSIKSVGWNDVAKGQTPCNLRSFEDLLNNSPEFNNCCHYSDFEKGKTTANSSYKYKGDENNTFTKAIDAYFKSSLEKNSTALHGRNIPFCFKTIHNFYEGEANQVHTKSLHAEENAMLQIIKNGGLGILGGFLFTTASPCELCSKKAYQIGITKIFFIDPYPGISNDQIINCGTSRPVLIPFLGAIGNVYHKLYELFISQKDEISMILEIENGQNLSKKIRNVLESRIEKENKIISTIKAEKYTDDEIIKIIKLGITQYNQQFIKKNNI